MKESVRKETGSWRRKESQKKGAGCESPRSLCIDLVSGDINCFCRGGKYIGVLAWLFWFIAGHRRRMKIDHFFPRIGIVVGILVTASFTQTQYFFFQGSPQFMTSDIVLINQYPWNWWSWSIGTTSRTIKHHPQFSSSSLSISIPISTPTSTWADGNRLGTSSAGLHTSFHLLVIVLIWV